MIVLLPTILSVGDSDRSYFAAVNCKRFQRESRERKGKRYTEIARRLDTIAHRTFAKTDLTDPLQPVVALRSKEHPLPVQFHRLRHTILY